MTRPPDCTETGKDYGDEKDDHDGQNGVSGDSDTNHLDHKDNTEDIGVLCDNEKKIHPKYFSNGRHCKLSCIYYHYTFRQSGLLIY